MFFWYGKSSDINIKLDKVSYEFYYYAHLCKLIGITNWLMQKAAPDTLDEQFPMLFTTDPNDILVTIMHKFPVFVRAYLEVKFGPLIKKIIVPHELNEFPLNAFLTKENETIYFLYDKKKLQDLVNKFLIVYSLYTSNIENLFSPNADKHLMYDSEHNPYLSDRLDDPYRDINKRSQLFVDYLTTKTTYQNSGVFRNPIRPMISDQTYNNVQREAYVKIAPGRYPNKNLPHAIAHRRSHLTILSFFFNILETGLKEIMTEVTKEANDYSRFIRQFEKNEAPKNESIKLFEHKFNVQFEKNISPTILW